MAKLTKRVIDGLQSDGSKHGTLYWDSELKGFGIRVFPTRGKTFVVKFRTRSGRQRWLKIGTFGALTAERARERARVELARVVDGEDPADERDQLRAAVTVAQVCDLYMAASEAGLVLGRKGTPKKPRTVSTDRSRIDAHVRPLLGQLATDIGWAGRDIGTGLVKHALQRCVTASKLIGGRALVVNAVDEEAPAFWRRRGFLPSKDDSCVLFRSIAAIAASLGESAATPQ